MTSRMVWVGLVWILSSICPASSWTLRPLPSGPKVRRLASDQESDHRPEHKTIVLPTSGRKVRLRSRHLEIDGDWKIRVWEWEHPSEVVESYWEAQQQQHPGGTDKLLDPFGLVSWPGSVVAARELKDRAPLAVVNQTVLVLGAGVGVEAQAAGELGAQRVLATDIHPTTLLQLQVGFHENKKIGNHALQTLQLDLFDDEIPLPASDLVVVADVLYNEALASQVVKRLVEAYQQNPGIQILVTDSQRFVDGFTNEWNELLLQAFAKDGSLPRAPIVDWSEEAFSFTGSGVCIDEDQTYNVTVRKLWFEGPGPPSSFES